MNYYIDRYRDFLENFIKKSIVAIICSLLILENTSIWKFGKNAISYIFNNYAVNYLNFLVLVAPGDNRGQVKFHS